MLNRGLDKLELLRIVDAVANEKSIDKELVIGSMESAIQKAALTKFGNDNNIEVVIDRESGNIKIQKVLDIVEKVEDSAREISLDDAKKNDPKNENLKVISSFKLKSETFLDEVSKRKIFYLLESLSKLGSTIIITSSKDLNIKSSHKILELN